ILLTIVTTLISLIPIHGADMLYVSLQNNSIVTYDVSKLTASSVQNSIRIFANTNLNLPQGFAFDNQGNLYVANLGNTIAKFNPAGVF
ncbi:MAG: hypothetical protein ACKO85_03580, partial [Isosphaeraceae bacterium]